VSRHASAGRPGCGATKHRCRPRCPGASARLDRVHRASGRLSLGVRNNLGSAVNKSISDTRTRAVEARLKEVMVLVIKAAHEHAGRARSHGFGEPG
jgi:hypothetical protein